MLRRALAEGGMHPRVGVRGGLELARVDAVRGTDTGAGERDARQDASSESVLFPVSLVHRACVWEGFWLVGFEDHAQGSLTACGGSCRACCPCLVRNGRSLHQHRSHVITYYLSPRAH